MKRLLVTVLTVAMLLTFNQSAHANLAAVGPTDPANGFPVWFQDSNGLTLKLCLGSGFCIADPVIAGNAFSEQIGFGSEAFWFDASSDLAFAGGDLLLVMATEAAFGSLDGAAEPGQQWAFGRIRMRGNVSTPGTYTITTPFKTFTVTVDTILPGAPEINITEDIGTFAAPPNFAAVLGSSIGGDGVVGSFLTPASGTFLNIGGRVFIGDGVTPVAVTGSPTGNNFLRMTGPGVNVTNNLFSLQGEVAFCGPADNSAPTATADAAIVRSGGAVPVSVLLNDLAGSVTPALPNDAAINPKTVAITVQGTKGTAVANADGTVTYTGNAGLSGIDTFQYAVTDFCGIPSAAATVTVDTEKADVKVEFDAKLLRWKVSGLTSHATVLGAPNQITIHSSADGTGPAIVTIPAKPDGTFVSDGKSFALPHPGRMVSIRTSNGLVFPDVPMVLR